ncbi:MAG: DNA replication/repair protein RecF [Acidimicrobiales bacterium]
MYLRSLTLTDFRCLRELSFEPDPEGVTVVTGPNGTGKTSVLEAIAYLATQQSFRGVPRESLVRVGATAAVVRGVAVAGERSVSVDAEVSLSTRSRMLVNGQPVRRRSDLDDGVQATVFTPEDTEVVRGGPAARRRFLDDAVALVAPLEAVHIETVERVLRQRAALLKRSRGHLNGDLATTLDVWDQRLAAAGSALSEARERVLSALAPEATETVAQLTGSRAAVGLTYRRSWNGSLEDALAAGRADDLVRGTTLVGPHRDDVELTLDGLAARTHASQGEQRTLALALRLATHRLATYRLATPPVLLLDDVFSELDHHRAASLLASVPPGQTLLTTAVPPPPTVPVAATIVLGQGAAA